MSAALRLDLLQDPAAIAAAIDPARRRILANLSSPDSAAGLARRLGLPRQQVNYHLRELEKAGLLRLVEERKKGNCTERLVQATATHYLVNPEVLGELAEDPVAARDCFSWATLVMAAARAIRELATLRSRADAARKHLQTLTLEADVRFANAEALNGFSTELMREFARLVAKYHDRDAKDGRVFRCLLGTYPAVTKSESEARAEAEVAQRSAQTEPPEGEES